MAKSSKDLANQIAFSTRYQNEMKQLGLKPGQYLAPSAGEWFQGWARFCVSFGGLWKNCLPPGLPEGWTSDVEGAVNPRALPEQFGAWDSQDCFWAFLQFDFWTSVIHLYSSWIHNGWRKLPRSPVFPFSRASAVSKLERVRLTLIGVNFFLILGMAQIG